MTNPVDISQLHDMEAEQYVLGGCLNDYSVFPMVSLVLKPQDFFFKRHEYIFDAMCQLNRAGDDIDVPTVAMKLREMGKDSTDYYDDLLNEVGGQPHLIYLENQVMKRPLNYARFAARVKYLSNAIALAQATDAIKTLAFRQDMSSSVKLNEAELLLQKIRQQSIEQPTPTIGEMAMDFADSYNAALEGNGRSRLYTGYNELDNPPSIVTGKQEYILR